MKTLSITGEERVIPVTMATQHPDNVSKPSWSQREDGKITTDMEIEEAHRNFSDLGIEETMWDNEGKEVDYTVCIKLVSKYPFFKEKQVGKDVFITYRIPNRWQQKGTTYKHPLAAIPIENENLQEHGFHSPALFEVILPFTTNSYQLAGVQYDYVVNSSSRTPEFLEIIPLIEGSARLSDIQKILNGYTDAMKTIWNIKLNYVRPFLARSDPALDAGLIPADLFALGGLSECYQFSKKKEIEVFPIIGAGPSPFRGGLAPERIEKFLQKFPGFRTGTIQSSFRYDHDEQTVKKAVEKLKIRMPKTEPRIFSKEDLKKMFALMRIFSEPYQETIQGDVAHTISYIATEFLPSHRERLGHVGHFGYSRGKDTALPRAIKFVAALDSLGVPPGIIGTGRGIKDARKKGFMKFLEEIMPKLKEDLVITGRYLNKKNLEQLAKTNALWKDILEDVELIEQYIDQELGPGNDEEEKHNENTTKFFDLYRKYQKNQNSENKKIVIDAAMDAARERKYLG